MSGTLIGISAPAPLALETRRRNPINNELNWMASTPGEVDRVAALKRQYRTGTHRDVGPCRTYNCHGLTFAARRTWIHESSEVQKILTDDDYVRLDWQQIMPGDIAIYRAAMSMGGAIDHSGIVVGRRQLNGVFHEPVILSKWGALHEVVHLASECPYSEGCTIEYYRMLG